MSTEIKYQIACVITNPQATGKNLYTDGNDKVVVDTNGVTFTGTRASGSAVVSGITSTASLAPGMFVIASAGFAAGTYILSVDSNTQVTMSANATGNGSTTFTCQSELFRYPTSSVVNTKNLGGTVAEVQQVTDVSWTAGNNTTYTFVMTQPVTTLADNPDPIIVSYTSDSSGTSTEIAAGLAAVINSYVSDEKLKVSVVQVPSSDKITITALAGYPIFVVSGTQNCTASTTTPGVNAFGLGAQLRAQFLPPDNSQQVQRPSGVPYINTNYPLVGTTYWQAYIDVLKNIGTQGMAPTNALFRYYYMIVSGTNASDCASDLTA